MTPEHIASLKEILLELQSSFQRYSKAVDLHMEHAKAWVQAHSVKRAMENADKSQRRAIKVRKQILALESALAMAGGGE